jgi:hypothetical protein
MSKNPLPVTVMTCGSRILSVCAVLTLKGNFWVVQLNTICLISHHFGANWDFGANRSHAVAVGILKCNVNITVCLDFCINNAASKRVPFLLSRQSFLACAR